MPSKNDLSSLEKYIHKQGPRKGSQRTGARLGKESNFSTPSHFFPLKYCQFLDFKSVVLQVSAFLSYKLQNISDAMGVNTFASEKLVFLGLNGHS